MFKTVLLYSENLEMRDKQDIKLPLQETNYYLKWMAGLSDPKKLVFRQHNTLS